MNSRAAQDSIPALADWVGGNNGIHGAWCWTLSPFAGILAAVVAKHILVAILAAGLSLPDDETKRGR